MARMVSGNRGGSGASLSADRSTYLTNVSAGALIAALADPFGSGSSYATVGSVPGQLALSAGTIVAGASASVADVNYAIKVRATSSDGKREVAETLTFTATAAVVAPALAALGLSSTALSIGGATSVTVTGRTAGSAIAATSSDGTALSVSGSTLTGTFTAAGSPTITLIETLAGATGSPRTTSIVVTVTAGGTLAPLALTERLAFFDNSYGAQTLQVDSATWAWAFAGCRGVPTIGMKQSRGGDRISHLIDRIAPAKAVRAGCAVVMNPINDTNVYGTNDNAAGDSMLALFDTVVTNLRALKPDCRIIGQTVGAGVTTYQSKPISMARYEAGIDARAAADPRTVKFSPNGVVDFTDTSMSFDQLHPNTRKGGKAYGQALGAKIAAQFVADDIFAAGLSLPNNLVTFNPATAWAATANSSGLTSTQSLDFLLSRPTVACRKLNITGTTSQDPTSSGSTADYRLRVTMNLPAGFNSDDLVAAHVMLIEIRSSATANPIGLAALQLNGNVGTAFNKQLATTDGLWVEGYAGPFGIIPNPDISAILAGQASQWNFDLTVRGQSGVAADIEVRIAAINVIDTEAVSYHDGFEDMAKAFTIGDGTTRSLLRPLPTTAPATGSVAVGATIAKAKGAFFVGGGATRTYDAMRDGATDVGDMVGPKSGAAAIPYTTVSGDSGHTIQMRANLSKTIGGTTYSASTLSAPITVP